MRCLEFRRRLLEAPLENAPGLEAHEAECPGCAAYARRVRRQERQLRSALEVSPPPALAERVELALSFEQLRGRRRLGWGLGLAAGVLLLLGAQLAPRLLAPDYASEALAQAVVHHIQDESSHLHASGPITGRRLQTLFARFGARLEGPLGRVNFAAECLMRRKTGVHLVLPGRMGPVTVFFMPDETPLEPLEVETPRFEGEVIPTLWGSIAVVGERGEPLQEVERRMRAAVVWPASRTAAL